jgi:ParB family chromosome partitioning protein
MDETPDLSRTLTIKEIPVSEIRISELNARNDLQSGTEDSNLDDLARSIHERGLLNPLTVLYKNGKYELIVGKRRFLACQSLGWKTVPAIVRTNLDDVNARILSLIENVHRADLHPLDKAKAYQQIYETFGTYSKVSEETGVSIPTVKRYLSLLQLAPSIQAQLTTSDGHAGICTLSRLAELFQDFEEQEHVLQSIEGFTQQVQIEILNRSGGDIDRIDSLCEQALGGCFKVFICKGLDGCPHIPQECVEDIKRIISSSKTAAPIRIGASREEALLG